MAKKTDKGKARFKRGDRVEIEQGYGEVRTAKFSPQSGWWYEIRLPEYETWTVHEDNVKEAK